MAYVNLSNEQAAKLASMLGPEFTAVAKNELLNFADALLEIRNAQSPKVEAKKEAAPPVVEAKPATKFASKKA